MKITESRTPAIWTTSKCYFRELLFAFLKDIENVNKNADHQQQCTMSIIMLKNSKNIANTLVWHI